MRLKDPLAKSVLRKAYRTACGISVLANTLSPRADGIQVYYGGARVGDVGGPLVKIKRLRERFPERRWGYNLVYVLSNTPYLPATALRLLKSRHIPIVHNQNGVFYGAWYAGDWQAQNARMAVPYRLADYVFYQSEFCRRSAERFLGPRAGPGEVLYNAVDTQRFMPAADRSGRPFTFLLTGKIDSHLFYRLESTILGMADAVKEGLDCRLVIAGWVAADARQRSEHLAAKLGLQDQVEFTGPYTQEQAPSIYSGADAYVMTKHNDPCPNTVLEALACGLPIVYSNSGGVPELVGSEAGVGVFCEESWECPLAPDPAAIGAAMLKVAAHRGAMAAAARQRAVMLFDIEHWLLRHEEIFLKLLQGASA